jgi:hypothetical protein
MTDDMERPRKRKKPMTAKGIQTKNWKDVAARERPMFVRLCALTNIPQPAEEWEFDSVRHFRFDYAWPESRVALEVDGGIFSGGPHTRGTGFAKDVEKLNLAAEQGWLVLRCCPGEKDKVKYRASKATGASTGTTEYYVPALLNLTTARMVKRALEARFAQRQAVGHGG